MPRIVLDAGERAAHKTEESRPCHRGDIPQTKSINMVDGDSAAGHRRMLGGGTILNGGQGGPR